MGENIAHWEGDATLHTYCYDYFLRRGWSNTASSFAKDVGINEHDWSGPAIQIGQGLLFEWWTVFWEVFAAKNSHPSNRSTTSADEYLNIIRAKRDPQVIMIPGQPPISLPRSSVPPAKPHNYPGSGPVDVQRQTLHRQPSYGNFGQPHNPGLPPGYNQSMPPPITNNSFPNQSPLAGSMSRLPSNNPHRGYQYPAQFLAMVQSLNSMGMHPYYAQGCCGAKVQGIEDRDFDHKPLTQEELSKIAAYWRTNPPQVIQFPLDMPPPPFKWNRNAAGRAGPQNSRTPRPNQPQYPNTGSPNYFGGAPSPYPTANTPQANPNYTQQQPPQITGQPPMQMPGQAPVGSPAPNATPRKNSISQKTRSTPAVLLKRNNGIAVPEDPSPRSRKRQKGSSKDDEPNEVSPTIPGKITTSPDSMTKDETSYLIVNQSNETGGDLQVSAPELDIAVDSQNFSGMASNDPTNSILVVDSNGPNARETSDITTFNFGGTGGVGTDFSTELDFAAFLNLDQMDPMASEGI